MATVKLTVTGEFISDHAKNLIFDGKWTDAIRFLQESLIGITLDMTIKICRGEIQLTGSNDKIEVVEKIDEELQEQLRYMYAGVVKLHGKFYRPYAYVSNYGPRDAQPIEHPKVPHSWWGPDPKLEYRAYHYLKDLDHDIVEYVNHAKYSCVLFKEVKEPPFWLKLNDDKIKAIDEFEEYIMKLEETGHSQKYGNYACNEYHKLRPIDERTKVLSPLTPEEETEKYYQDMLKSYPLITRKDNNFDCAWLSPEGVFYVCETTEHDVISQNIIYSVYGKSDVSDTQQELERYGWIKLAKSPYNSIEPLFICTARPTRQQLDSIESWCIDNNVDYEKVSRDFDRY